MTVRKLLIQAGAIVVLATGLGAIVTPTASASPVQPSGISGLSNRDIWCILHLNVAGSSEPIC